MSQTYTPDQKAFTLAMLANMLNQVMATGPGLDQKLSDLIKEQLTAWEPQLEPWQINWGPCVYQSWGVDKGPPDNAMYAVQDQAGTELVVGIAGTNPNLQNWLEQNLNVVNVVPWKPETPLVLISDGARTGQKALLDMRPRAGLPAEGKSLIEFVKAWVAAAGKPVTVTIAGHSLGGVLSTVIGLWLHEDKSEWDPSNQVTLKVWTSGGPSVGNRRFAERYDQALGGNTTRFSNSLDPITYAWNAQTLSQIPKIYSAVGGPEAGPVFSGLVGLVCGLVLPLNYTHILANTPPVAGKYKGGTYDEEAGYQHGEGYLELMGVLELAPAMVRRGGAANVPPSTEPERTLEDIVKKAAESGAIRAAQG